MKFLLLAALFLLQQSIFADQCAILDSDMADEAVVYFAIHTDVVLWCACCSNDVKEYLKVSEVYIKGENNWNEIVLKGKNGEGRTITTTVDLAYTHVVKEGMAYCAGVELKCGADPCTEPFSFNIPRIPDLKDEEWNFGEMQFGNNSQNTVGYTALEFPAGKKPDKRFIPYNVSDKASWITTVGFSNDEKYLITGGGYFEKSSFLKVLEVASGNEVFDLNGHDQAITSLAVSPTEDIFASADQAGQLIVWNFIQGKKLYEISEHNGDWVEGLCFSRDGKYIASAGRDNNVCVFEAANGKLLRKFKVDFSAATSIEFSPDNRTLCVGGKAPAEMYKMFDLARGEEIMSAAPVSDWCKDIKYSPDGSKIGIAADCDYAAIILDVSSGNIIKEIAASHGCVESISWDPSGRYLLLGSLWGIEVYDVVSGHFVFTARTHAYPIEKAYFSPSGDWLVTASRDDELHLWRLNKID